MTEGLLWWQWIIGAAMFFVLAASTFVLVLSLVRFSSQLSEEERFERQQRRQRARLNSVAGNGHVRETEHGTARTDLAAFAGLLLCVALVGAAIWAASGWWG